MTTEAIPEPQPQVVNHRPDPFSFVFRSHGGSKVRRPLRVEKLIGGRWILMALFCEPQDRIEAGYPERLADVIGGVVRLTRDGTIVEEWEGGEPVRQTRCA